MAAQFHDGRGPLAERDLASVERELGVQFPADYRAFMVRHNGGRAIPKAFKISWQQGQPPAEDWRTSALSWLFFVWDKPEANLLRMNTVTYKDRIPEQTVAIGTDAFGNPILLAFGGPHKGKVLFWSSDHEVEEGQTPGYDNVGVIADSFSDFLSKLY
jgi:hypothetical protein